MVPFVVKVVGEAEMAADAEPVDGGGEAVVGPPIGDRDGVGPVVDVGVGTERAGGESEGLEPLVLAPAGVGPAGRDPGEGQGMGSPESDGPPPAAGGRAEHPTTPG